jgi:hypothetical protein
MTTDLSLTNLFEGKEVRLVEHNGDVWMPVSDLAAAWGIDRTTPIKIINRNLDVFKDMVTILDGDITSHAGFHVNERGLYLMMGKISASRLKFLAAKEAIIRFQKWYPELVQKYRKKEIVQIQKGPDYPGIIQKLKFIRSVHEETGWNLLELQKEVLREAGMISLTYHIEPEKPVALPAPPKPKDYLTATDIGERCGKSAEEVNIWMYQRKPPLIIRDDVSGWRLTTWGKDFGEERAVELVGGTVVWRIKWKKDVLRLFNVFDHMEMD